MATKRTTTKPARKPATAPAATAPAVAAAAAVPVHPKPHVARVLAFAAAADQRGVTYPTAAALCRAAGVHGKALQRDVRQVLRDQYGATASRTAWGARAAQAGAPLADMTAQAAAKLAEQAAAQAATQAPDA
jgi:hypothetical protein